MPVFQYPYDFTCTCKTCKSCIKYKEVMEEAAWNVKIMNIRKAYVEKRVEEITKRLRNLSLKDSAQTCPISQEGPVNQDHIFSL